MISDNTIKILELELEEQRLAVVKASALFRLPIIGRFFKNKLIRETVNYQEKFRITRQIIREYNPERFISSNGNDVI